MPRVASDDAKSQQQRECTVCGPRNAAERMPYSYVVGNGIWYLELGEGAPEFTKINAPADCNEFLVGATTDCPTPHGQPGACRFSRVVLEDNFPDGNGFYDTQDGPGNDFATGCPLYNYVCTKLVYDEAFAESCCLGRFQASATMNFAIPALGTSATEFASMVVCDPRWCPLDPFGACEDVYARACTGSVSNDGGLTWVSALLAESDAISPCGTWYKGALGALAGEAPLSRWGVVDRVIGAYCSNPANSHDSVSCACYDFVGNPDTQLYTSYSGGSCKDQTGAPLGVCPVRQTDAQTNNTLNVSDYACIAPQCALGGPQLVTHDVWGRQKQGGCPDICLQVVSDGTLVLDGDTITGGVYADTSSILCGGAQGSVTSTAVPVLASMTDRVDVFWPHYASNPSACPTGRAEGPGCASQPVQIAFALDARATYGDDGAVTLPYAISFDVDPATAYNGLYSDIVWTSPQQGTLTNGNDGTMAATFNLNVNASSQSTHAAVPDGTYPLTVTLQDTTDPTVFRRVIVTTRVYATDSVPPPQGPAAPDGGHGPPVIVDRTAPPWTVWVVVAVSAVVLIVLLHLASLLWERSALQRELARLPASASAPAPSRPTSFASAPR
jgi:hypothetical protein